MKMTIGLSRFGDGPTYPQVPEGASATVGQIVLGPSGVLNLFEGRLGLKYPDVAEAVRIGQYLDCLGQVDDGSRFFSRSYTTDAWESARTLLAWRDELVLGGWDGNPVPEGGGRLDALAAAEQVATEKLSPGFSDRFRTLLQTLANWPVSLEWLGMLRLYEPRDTWEPWWQNLFAALEKLGTAIEELGLPEGPIIENDLGQAKKRVLGIGSNPYQGDTSLTLVRSRTEADMAEVLAAWLAADPPQDLVLIASETTELLDQTMRCAGLPGVGVEHPSPHRAILETLPAAWETFWEPVDVGAYLNWLTLPASPIPRGLARRLSRELAERPGVGGPDWREAMAASRARYETRLEEEDPHVRTRRLRKWDGDVAFWFSHDHYDPRLGIPVQILDQIIERIKQWSAIPQGGEPPSLYLAGLANVLWEAILSSGLGQVPRNALNRMWDSVVGAGIPRTDAREEAASWTWVSHPGAVLGSPAVVVWWDFQSKSRPSVRSPWVPDEMQALLHAGVAIDPMAHKLDRESAAWARPVHSASDAVLLFNARECQGAPTFLHPLWDALVDDKTHPLMVEATDVEKTGTITMAGRSIQYKAQPARKLPDPIDVWPISPGLVEPRERESASSLSELFSCTFRWVLDYIARIKPSDRMRLPHEKRMVGTLVHALVQAMLEQQREWSPQEAYRAALIEFDRWVPWIAAPLLKPDKRLVYERTRVEAARAIQTLFTVISEENLTIRGSEERHERPWGPGQVFTGTLDLRLEKDGQPIVLDMKWTDSKSYEEQVRSGLALQLVAYSWLIKEDQKDSPAAGYALLKQGRIAWALDNAEASWELVQESYPYYLDVLQREAWSPVSEARFPPGVRVISGDPGCRYCTYHQLCGQRRNTK